MRIRQRSDMWDVGREFQNTVVIQVYHGAHVAPKPGKIKP